MAYDNPIVVGSTAYDNPGARSMPWQSYERPALFDLEQHWGVTRSQADAQSVAAQQDAAANLDPYGLLHDPESFDSQQGPQHETRPPTTADGRPWRPAELRKDAPWEAPKWARSAVEEKAQHGARQMLPELLAPAERRAWRDGEFERASRRFEQEDKRERRMQRKQARAAKRAVGRTAALVEHGLASVEASVGEHMTGGAPTPHVPTPHPHYHLPLRLHHQAPPRTAPGPDERIDEATDDEEMDDEERFLQAQYGRHTMQPVPLSSRSPRSRSGVAPTPPKEGRFEPHSPRQRRTTGRTTSGFAVHEQRAPTPASFSSYDEASEWLNARPRVLA